MKKELILFRCKHCGNLIMFVENSGVKIVCCGENMEELKVNTIDGIHEKHLPVIELNDNKAEVKIGSIDHPMESKHYIEWICLETLNTRQIVYLKPGDNPKNSFVASEELLSV